MIWLMGGDSNEGGWDNFSKIGTGTDWTQVSSCVTATTSHTQLRIQLYSTPGAPTVDIDAVETGDVSGSGPDADCTPNDSCTPQTFADTLLSQPGIDAPITASNEYALETWALAEGGGAGCPGQPPNQVPWQRFRRPGRQSVQHDATRARQFRLEQRGRSHL